MEVLIKKIKETLGMNDEILGILDNEDLKNKLPKLRSSSIGNQLHCIGGARESYSKSIISDKGFEWNCSLSYDDRHDIHSLKDYLNKWKDSLLDYLNNNNVLSNNQQDPLIDLHAHEFLHQGQLIRYIYANNIKMPKLWKDMWHLSN